MSCDRRRSPITHPDAISFLRILQERVFQQPRLFTSTDICKNLSAARSNSNHDSCAVSLLDELSLVTCRGVSQGALSFANVNPRPRPAFLLRLQSVIQPSLAAGFPTESMIREPQRHGCKSD